MIEVRTLTKTFGDAVAVQGVSFTVAPGELLVLVGGSGSGKTTTLRMINRLIEPDSGTVLFDGVDSATIPGHILRRRIGYVFQKIGLFPHMTVAANIATPLRLLDGARDEPRIRRRVAEVLELMELPESYGSRYPGELSGGEQQRVGVARALAFENAYALAMRRDRAAGLGVRRIGDLAAVAPRLAIGGDYEFFDRVEWRAIRERYGLVFREQRSMDPSLMYQAVSQGTVDVISAFSTDGRIAALDLVLLDDDRGAIPPYDALLLASATLKARHPEVIAALRALSGSIDADAMRRMNLAVDAEGRSPADVAREFLAIRSR